MSGAAALRAYGDDDFETVAAFWVEAWRAVVSDVDFVARAQWLRGHLTDLSSSGVDVLVALDGGGCPRGLVTIDRRTGYLDQLCVARAEQGGGMARRLLDEAKRRSGGEVTLDVNIENVRAIAFYGREGFEAYGSGTSRIGKPTTKMRWRAAKGTKGNAP